MKILLVLMLVLTSCAVIPQHTLLNAEQQIKYQHDADFCWSVSKVWGCYPSVLAHSDYCYGGMNSEYHIWSQCMGRQGWKEFHD